MPGIVRTVERILLVANPISGRGKVERHLDKVAELLKRVGVHVDVFTTEKKGDARRAASECCGGAILCFGGDGTFNEVLNGTDLDASALGIIPAGTGNVLAKELGIPRSPALAVQTLLNGKIVSYDLGYAGDRRFISVFGAGLDAHIVDLVHRKRGGKLTLFHYIPFLFRQAFQLPQWDISVRVDGQALTQRGNVVCIGNGRSYGGPIQLTPAACPQDGEFDAMVTQIGGPAEIWNPALAALLRCLHACRSARYTRGKRFSVQSPCDDVPWQVDGDLGGTLPIEVWCEPGRVRMIAPRDYQPGPNRYSAMA